MKLHLETERSLETQTQMVIDNLLISIPSSMGFQCRMKFYQMIFKIVALSLPVNPFLVSFDHYLGCSDEGLLQMRQPNLTHYSFPKQLLSKSLLCPMFFPFKSHQNPWWCLRSQNMTCHPMTKHLDQVFACLTNALTFLQPSPYLFPLFSRNIPTSFPDHSQFCPHPSGFF